MVVSKCPYYSNCLGTQSLQWVFFSIISSLNLEFVAFLDGNGIVALRHRSNGRPRLPFQRDSAARAPIYRLRLAIKLAVDVHVHARPTIMHMTACENDVSVTVYLKAISADLSRRILFRFPGGKLAVAAYTESMSDSICLKLCTVEDTNP
jgi:hypothetical protein